MNDPFMHRARSMPMACTVPENALQPLSFLVFSVVFPSDINYTPALAVFSVISGIFGFFCLL